MARPLGELRFYLDENVPTEVARQLRQSGIDAVSAGDLNLLGTSDLDHLRQATADGRVLCTHDQDFLRLAAEGAAHTGIVFLPQARGGIGMSAITKNAWAASTRTRRQMPEPVSKYLAAIDGLDAVAARFRHVLIEHMPALDFVPKYDGPDVLFYCDPPYLHETRGDSKAYGFEMDEDAHRDLAAVLNKVRGKAAISGYRCDLMDELYEGWRRFDAPEKHCHSIKKPRQESLWMNY